VLDLGCGDGRFSAALVGAGASVVGVDASAEALRRARTVAPGAEFVKSEEGVPLPFGGDSFDLVWCGETLEHVVDVAQLLGEVRRVLVAGGMLLATTPNHARLRVAFEALAGGPLERRLDPRSDHLRFFTAHTLRELLSGAGFEQVSVTAVDGPPLLRRSLIARAR
jgi:2-polyprenyl-3-methyl-5-hydroxy-6-metoxy-1,4-benzoquinol methylase